MHDALADLVLLLHFGFILFVVCGGLLVIRWRQLGWLHLPAVAWGVWIEVSGRLCPLTPLENYFRQQAGKAGYRGGFIEEYLLPVIYPAELSRDLQLLLGIGLIISNLVLYGIVYRHAIKKALHRLKRQGD